MSIRTTQKDQLPDHARVALAVDNATVLAKTDRDAEGVQYAPASVQATPETERFLVRTLSGRVYDFSVLADGYACGSRKGESAFTGRRELLVELLPAIRDLALSEADLSTEGTYRIFRFFWRTLDEMEARVPGAPQLKSVLEISSVHRQSLIDRGIFRADFCKLRKVLNLTRLGLGEKQLNWPGVPAKGPGKAKQLPDLPDVKRIKNALKRLWFGWRDRHDHARHLLSLPQADRAKLPQEQRFILESLLRFTDAQERHGVALPTAEQLNPDGIRARPGLFMGYPELCSYFFPDHTAIKAAFHLCLATTGWNEAVLVNLKVDDEIFLTHPTDEKRYIMKGVKRRAGGAEQRCDGLKKTQHGPYAIINFLKDVSEPLRKQLRARGEVIEAVLSGRACRLAVVRDGSDVGVGQRISLTPPGLDEEGILALQQEQLDVQAAIRSFWLYATTTSAGPTSGLGGIHRVTKTAPEFLMGIIRNLNERNPEQPIGNMSASDFRDAYALHWYAFSGGDILTVMRVLNHRRVGTTVAYTNNVVVRVRNQKKARQVLKAWWGEVEECGEADPTVVSFRVRHGKPSEELRERLKTYRTLMLTQLGTRCSDPQNPPAHVAPHFVPDGKKVCDVQRCMLCVSHAVITPESLDGIARRFAELAYIKAGMSVAAWEAATAYIEEIENSELALAGFGATDVQEAVERWTARIESGEHRVMPFESS